MANIPPEAGTPGSRGQSAAVVLACLALALAAASCSRDAAERAAVSGDFAGERGAGLGPDDRVIDAIRVAVETGRANGAGTQNPVLVWFNNRGYRISRAPVEDFAPGTRAVVILHQEDLPHTLGELRRSSILLTLHLTRAAIASSWYCERATVEVKLADASDFQTYLNREAIGWLSQDEPPRRSPAYALQ